MVVEEGKGLGKERRTQWLEEGIREYTRERKGYQILAIELKKGGGSCRVDIPSFVVVKRGTEKVS